MRDPFSWSVPLGRMFGITVRVHLLFIVVAIGLILRSAVNKAGQEPRTGAWADMTMLMGLLFLSVLLHEFGHCIGARLVDGDAHEVLLWPLGGLASVEVPHTARANFITAAAGPLVNLGLCTVCIALLSIFYEGVHPSWNPLAVPLRAENNMITLPLWQGGQRELANVGAIVLARVFYVNWLLFLANVVIVGFPLDGGRMLHSLLWPRLGFHDAMQVAIYVGLVFSVIVAIASIMMNELLVFGLAAIIGWVCYRQWVLLITEGEESVLGYDFSQGYTSLERDQPPSRRRKRPNFFQRWRQSRAAARVAREQQQREAEERRMDELLERVHRDGIQALNDEERRFLKRVSDKYRNRQ
jgi:Zn-dependent protease